MNTRSYCTESGTKIRRGTTSAWCSENLGQLVLWPTYCISHITDLSKPFMTKWFSYIINDFRISYMICSIENIVSYQYFMIDMTFCDRLRFWPEWTIYHFNCTYVTNPNIYLRTQSELNLMRNHEDSETHFLWQKKLTQKKCFHYGLIRLSRKG